jgi:hypothetical protein
MLLIVRPLLTGIAPLRTQRHIFNEEEGDTMDRYTSTTPGSSSSQPSRFAGLLLGLALGALAMYAMDPRQGKRRRAEVKDKLYSASLKTRKTIDAKSRHFANRAKGMQAKANRLLH